MYNNGDVDIYELYLSWLAQSQGAKASISTVAGVFASDIHQCKHILTCT